MVSTTDVIPSCAVLRSERVHLNVRCSMTETPENINENHKIVAKIIKITNYWTGTSQLIPNTFRITCFLDDDSRNILEYQDLSKKEVLAQFNSKQSGSFDVEYSSESKEEKFIEKELQSVRKTKSVSKGNHK